MVAGTKVLLRLVCLLWLAPLTVHGFVTTLARKGETARVVRHPVVLAVDNDHGSSSTNRRRRMHQHYPIGVDWWCYDCTPLTAAGTAVTATTTRLYQSSPWWEGDDLRWTSRWRRRWFSGPKKRRPGDDLSWRPVTTTWCLVTLLLYVYQAFDTVTAIRRRYPYVWPSQAPRVIFDVLLGTARMGPLTAQLAATTASAYQMIHVEPYRFVTAFLVHGSVLHWGFVMFTLLRQLPPYLETELGCGVFATVLLFSTVFGHWFALAALAGQGSAAEAYLLGGTTGIAGLYGLLFVCLVRMENPTTTRQIGKGLG
jgi:membrane associated rhomboid family serine protease